MKELQYFLCALESTEKNDGRNRFYLVDYSRESFSKRDLRREVKRGKGVYSDLTGNAYSICATRFFSTKSEMKKYFNVS